jgi:hypothetical protein
MLTENITDEQLLKICLDHQEYLGYSMDGLSGELIFLYCYDKLGEDSPYDEVLEEVNQLCIDNSIANMVACGELEVQFTESGIEYTDPESQTDEA